MLALLVCAKVMELLGYGIQIALVDVVVTVLVNQLANVGLQSVAGSREDTQGPLIAEETVTLLVIGLDEVTVVVVDRQQQVLPVMVDELIAVVLLVEVINIGVAVTMMMMMISMLPMMLAVTMVIVVVAVVMALVAGVVSISNGVGRSGSRCCVSIGIGVGGSIGFVLVSINVVQIVDVEAAVAVTLVSITGGSRRLHIILVVVAGCG